MEMIYRILRWFASVIYGVRIKAAILGWAEYKIGDVHHLVIATTSLNAAVAFIHANQYRDVKSQYQLTVIVKPPHAKLEMHDLFSSVFPDIGAWSS